MHIFLEMIQTLLIFLMLFSFQSQFLDIMLLSVTVTFSGTNGQCEKINMCAENNPCENNSTCSMVSPGVASCQCLTGYTGSHCQHKISHCDPDPCVHGKCTDLVNEYSCDCDPGYNGEFVCVCVCVCIQ